MKVVSLALVSLLLSVTLAQEAQAACQVLKYRNQPASVRLLGFRIPAGNISFTAKSCWTPSTGRASPQRINSTTWVSIDSAGGNLLFSPGKRINQGAYTSSTKSGVSWATVEFKVRPGGEWNGVGLPAGQAVTIDVQSETLPEGFCLGSVGGTLTTQTSCTNIAP